MSAMDRLEPPWSVAAPQDTADFAGDCVRYSRYWEASAALLSRLPAKPRRNAEETQAAEEIKREARAARSRFLAAHAEDLYDRLTQNRLRFVRVEQLVYEAASLVPGLAPTRAQVAAESAHLQRDKDGVEIDQGIFVSAVLASPRAGRHLCHAMLLPRAEALERLPELEKSEPRRSRRGGTLPQGQGCVRHREESAPPERRRRHDHRRRRNRRGPRDSRPAHGDLRAARRLRAGRKAPGAPACSAAASTSPISTTARYRSSGTCSAIWAS